MADVTILGSIGARIEGNPYGRLEQEQENCGKISIAYGGTGRNIVENLARRGVGVAFISVVGDDFVGRVAVQELLNLGVNMDNMKILKQEDTTMHISILNILGDTEFSLSGVETAERISEDMIYAAESCLKGSKLVGMDGNLTEEMRVLILDKLEKWGIPAFLDPASEEKAVGLKSVVGRFHTIKPNRREAEILCGMSILSEQEMATAGQWFTEQGVKRVFITMGPGGVYYKEGDQEGVLRPVHVIPGRPIGGGDAFSAALMDGFVKGMNIGETAAYALGEATLAVKKEEKERCI